MSNPVSKTYNFLFALVFSCSFSCSCPTSLCAQPSSPQRQPDQQLGSAIAPLVQEHKGEVAVAIEHLDSGEFLLIDADRVMPTASLIKFPLLIATYHAAEQGDLDLDAAIALKEADKAPGSGVLSEHFSAGAVLPLRDYVRLMIRFSDNTATNVVIDHVGLRRTAELMESLDCENTKLHSKVYRRDTSVFPERSKQFGLGSTTAAEMVRLFALLHRGRLASNGATAEMKNHLLACDDDSKLARLLPPGATIAHKTGAVSNCRTDAGIIHTGSGPVAVCVLTNKNEDQRWSDDNEADVLCARIGEAIVNRFGGKTVAAQMQQGALGKMVETLQRTLNDRLIPSPGLAIDGDFGPATRAAVERFQRENRLTANGIVGSETWKALGTLLETDDPVPPPEVVRAEVLPAQPRPPLTGPPIVTCKAWAIGDANGNVIWESNADAKLEAASTTKIMTSYVVLKLARDHPEYFDEVVTFSQRADDTIGSTSGIRVGEKVTVGELLYGLLLPSGNDAAVALAEHFGPRLQTSTDREPAYESFIRAMNAAAAELGMTEANYVNPHGLSDPQHVISARNLLRLSAAAMEHELFRDIVTTRQFGCRIESNEGYVRNVRWTNTNELLAFEGYSGIKTGTTGAAGACLVSHGRHNGHELTVVTLGSSSSPSRYADTRNLFRWAWQRQEQRGAGASQD